MNNILANIVTVVTIKDFIGIFLIMTLSLASDIHSNEVKNSKNIGVHVSLSVLVSSVCMSSSGITGSYDSSISSF